MAYTPSLSYSAGGGTVPYSVPLAPGEDIELESVTVQWNGASASGAFLACLSIYSQDGVLLSRTYPTQEFAAGDTGEVTYAPFGGGLGGDGSGAPGADTDYVATLLGLSPRFFYRLNDAADPARDSSGNGLDLGTGGGTVQYQVPGARSGWLAALYNDSFRNRTGAGGSNTTVAVTFWINPTQYPGASTLFFQNGFGGGDGLTVSVKTNGHLGATLQGVVDLTQSTATLSLGAWSHVVLTRNGGVWTWYINGAVDTANAGTSAMNVPTGLTSVGQVAGGTDLKLSHVAWFDVGFSASDVTALYASAA